MVKKQLDFWGRLLNSQAQGEIKKQIGEIYSKIDILYWSLTNKS